MSEAVDGPVPAPEPRRGLVLLEVLVLFLATAGIIRALLALDRLIPWSIGHDLVLFSVAVVFLFTPGVAARITGQRVPPEVLLPWDLRKALRRAFVPFAWTVLAIYPAFVIGNHLYQGVGLPWFTTTFGDQLGLYPYPPHRPMLSRFPKDFATIALYQLLCVGYAEEYFYRGYMQTRLDLVFRGRRRIAGVEIGWGFLLTAVLFTLGHSLVSFAWWQPFIFFPALIFGWLRARTGNVLAGTLFHAFANTAMITLDAIYGVALP